MDSEAREIEQPSPSHARVASVSPSSVTPRVTSSPQVGLTAGKSAEEIGRLYRDMEVMMHSRNLGVDDEILDELGDAAALESTSQFANRVKCALLGWYALRDAMAKSGIDISTAGEPAEQ